VDFKFRVTAGMVDVYWVASGRDDLEAEEAVEVALEADGDLDRVDAIELVGEATQGDLDDHNMLFATER